MCVWGGGGGGQSEEAQGKVAKCRGKAQQCKPFSELSLVLSKVLYSTLTASCSADSREGMSWYSCFSSEIAACERGNLVA